VRFKGILLKSISEYISVIHLFNFQELLVWFKRNRIHKDSNKTIFDDYRLHYEIEEFVTYLCPTDIERMWRVFAIRRIEQCIKSSYPDAEIMVFGSFNTGLYLPTRYNNI
jgi:DNA polymerase sigma